MQFNRFTCLTWARRALALLLLLVQIGLAGCYSLVEVEGLSPATGAPVRAELSETGTQQMASTLGPGIVAVEGEFAGERDGEILLLVSTLESRLGGRMYWTREPVSFPPVTIQTLQERVLDRPRSYLTAVGIVVAAALAARLGASVFDAKPRPRPNVPIE